MNRERAEIFLRLLAEAELRDPALRRPPAIRSPDAPFVVMPVALAQAAWALTAVGALDLETAEAVLADAELALAARRPEPAGGGRDQLRGPGPGGRADGFAPVRQSQAPGPVRPADAARERR